MNATITSYKQHLDHLLLEAAKVSDDEMKSHLAKYICVLVSGYVESSIRCIIIDYATNKAHPYITTFVSNNAQSITNLKHEKIGQLLKLFSEKWYRQFSALISEEEKDAFDSIVANRHLIAHGRSVGMSFVRVKKFYEKIVEGIETIYLIVNS